MVTAILTALFLLIFPMVPNGQGINIVIDEEFNHLPENATIQEKWLYYENMTQSAVNKALDRLLPFVLRSSAEMNISTDCSRDMIKLTIGLRKMKMWAFRFIDSSSKALDGADFGSMSSFGSHEECIETVVHDEESAAKDKVLFRGQYCSIDFRPALPPKPKVYKTIDSLPELDGLFEEGTFWHKMASKGAILFFQSMRAGVCVPSSCTIDDVNQAVKMLGKSFSFDIKASSCEVKEKVEVTQTQIYVLCVYAFTAALMIIGTLIDVYLYYTQVQLKGFLCNFFLAFSLPKNFSRLISTEGNEGSFRCINGVRFFSMSWVILGHTNAIVNYRAYADFVKVGDHASSFAFQAIVNGYLAVDTFFCMGGFLVCYLTIKLVKIDKHPFRIELAIFRRLWRLVPVYFFVIIFIFLGPWFGSGPLWKETVTEDIHNCYDNWWTNLLFINNFYHADNMCIRQSWYLACDFQMFVYALFISLILLKSSLIGLILASLTVLGSVVYSGYMTFLMDYPPTLLTVKADKDYAKEYRANFFYQPFAHAAPYFIGYLTGYILAIKPKIKLSTVLQVVGWALAFACNFSVLYTPQPWNSGEDPTMLERLLYASFSRCAWAFGVAWLIFCCCTGHGGVVNYILSWDVFVPLSRLTFLAYLIHPLVITFFTGSIRTLLQSDYFLMVWFYFGHMFASYGIAFAGSMFLEAPFSALDKLMFKRHSSSSHSSAKSRDNLNRNRLGIADNAHIQVNVTKENDIPELYKSHFVN